MVGFVEPKKKLFCPREMLRYDGTIVGNGTIWVCQVCLKCLLSKEAVVRHLKRCKELTDEEKIERNEKYGSPCYICASCNKVFIRKSTLKKHLEVHESSSVSSERSDNKVEDDTLTMENANDEIHKPE